MPEKLSELRRVTRTMHEHDDPIPTPYGAYTPREWLEREAQRYIKQGIRAEVFDRPGALRGGGKRIALYVDEHQLADSWLLMESDKKMKGEGNG